MMRRELITGTQSKSDSATIEAINKYQIPLDSSKDLDALLAEIGDSKYVLLGESTHGTSEFYRWRAAISRRLIQEKGFKFIAVEGDWPDCFEVNKFIKGAKGTKKITQVLMDSFRRWPSWMWSNWEIAELMEWMKSHNSKFPHEKQAGFYGLDVYSLYESLECMKAFVKDLNDPETTEVAEAVFDCFQPYAKEPKKYGRAVTRCFKEGCRKQVVDLLTYMRKKYNSSLSQTKGMEEEEAFAAQMNTSVLVDAENYYKVMMSSGSESWNVRDDHMADTLDALMKFHGPDAKCIVWAHNTHVGDARFTDMIDRGKRNLGQIVRERHGDEGVFIVGFGTNEGSVIAGHAWDAPMDKKNVPSAPAKSWEALIRLAEGESNPNRMLVFSLFSKQDRKLFDEVRGHRAIGVVYDPQYDRFGHWVPTVLGQRYDAFIYLDKTMALHPLPAKVDLSLQPPQTYPWGVQL